jgi:hypothetical protein
MGPFSFWRWCESRATDAVRMTQEHLCPLPYSAYVRMDYVPIYSNKYKNECKKKNDCANLDNPKRRHRFALDPFS